jgi:hypothetical protein
MELESEFFYLCRLEASRPANWERRNKKGGISKEWHTEGFFCRASYWSPPSKIHQETYGSLLKR